jgi:hypothetical protein
MGSIAIKRRRWIAALLAAGAVVALALPGAAGATVASPIRAVFLKEFSKPTYQMDRGQLLVLANDDPFLTHSLAGSLVTAPALPGRTRLVRDSPYLAPGVYPFHDPAYPEMAATLTVTANGSSPPPDTTPPSGKVKVVSAPARKVARSGKLRVRVRPSEAVDVGLNLFVGKTKLASGGGAFTAASSGVLTILIPQQARKQLRPGTVVTVRAKLTDVTGKRTSKRVTGRLGGKPKGK